MNKQQLNNTITYTQLYIERFARHTRTQKNTHNTIKRFIFTQNLYKSSRENDSRMQNANQEVEKRD